MANLKPFTPPLNPGTSSSNLKIKPLDLNTQLFSSSSNYALDPAGNRLPYKLSLNLAKPRPEHLLTECIHYLGQLNNIWRIRRVRAETCVCGQLW